MKIKVIVHEAEEGGYWAEEIGGCSFLRLDFPSASSYIYDER